MATLDRAGTMVMPLNERSIAELKTQNPGHAFLYDATRSYCDGPITTAELASIMRHVSACGTLAWIPMLPD